MQKKNLMPIAWLWLLMAVGVPFRGDAGVPGAKISVHLGGAAIGDSLTLIYWQKTIGGNIGFPLSKSADHYAPVVTQYAHPNKDGVFVFDIDGITGPVYFSIYKDVDVLHGGGPQWLLQTYLMEPSDDVRIDMVSAGGPGPDMVALGVGVPGYLYNIADRKVVFSGPGSAKYACKYAVDTYCRDFYGARDTTYPGTSFANNGRYVPHNVLETLLTHSLHIIDSMKNDLRPVVSDLLKVDYTALYHGALLQALRKAVDMTTMMEESSLTPIRMDSERIVCLENVSRVFLDRFLDDKDFDQYSDKAKLASDLYSTYLTERVFTLKYLCYPNDNRVSVYTLFKKEYAGELRDKALTLYLMMHYKKIPDADNVLKDALVNVSTPYYQERLQELENLQGVGKAAYDFQLQDIKGKLVRLSDFKGKVVFIDFWFTGCGACQAFYKQSLSEVEHKFAGDTSVVFITVSVDAERSTWKKSLESSMYTSLEVVNLYTGGNGASDPVVDHYHVSAYPHPFVIDRDGNFFKTDHLQAPKEDLIQSINEALAKQ